jgi:plastocyanin
LAIVTADATAAASSNSGSGSVHLSSRSNQNFHEDESMHTHQFIASNHPSRARRIRTIGLASAGLLLVAISSACGHSSDSKAAAVTIKTFAFRPTPLEIKAGTKVTWTNEDQIHHTVTSGTRTYDAQGLTKDISRIAGFDLQLDGKGSRASFTFAKPGTIAYLCTIHPGMDTEVVVT